MAGPLSLRARGALLTALTLAITVLAVAPGRLGTPIRRLANYRADTRDPIYNAPLDAAAIRRAGELIPNSRRETYYIYTRPEPQLGHDLIGAGLLFFLPALAVPDPKDARWVLSYEAPTLLPRGLRPQRTYRLGRKVFLVRIGHT
ncbi:MAG: hypothetical protein QOG06_2632 [Gaiellaceae bacterium]|nr:hypothetical protein [Gaiellaceae bacterium]